MSVLFMLPSLFLAFKVSNDVCRGTVFAVCTCGINIVCRYMSDGIFQLDRIHYQIQKPSIFQYYLVGKREFHP